MAKDTWTDRDLPVLNAIVEMAEERKDSILTNEMGAALLK
jgi:hypothetical protein